MLDGGSGPGLAALIAALAAIQPDAAPPAPELPAAVATSDRLADDGAARPNQGGGLLTGTKLWGSTYYQAVGADGSGYTRGPWSVAQEAGLSVNVRSERGFELLANFVLPVDLDQNLSSRTVIQQLSVRIAPSDRVTIIGGKQRLDWGTALIFSAIDTLEPRANPLDVRPLPPGVSGLKAVVIPNDWLSLSVVVLPSSEARWSRTAARVDFVAEDAGLDLGFGAVRYVFADRDVAPGADPVKRARLALLSDGAWSSGDLVLYEELQLRRGREAGYRLPGMASFSDLDDGARPVFRGVAGVSYQLGVGLSRSVNLVAEYLYNGDGFSTGEARAFAADLAAWDAAGRPAGSDLPALLQGIGGFRRNYASFGMQNLAVRRYLLLSVNGIVGVDTLFSRFAGTVEWVPTQGTAVSARYEHFTSLAASSRPSELLMIPFRHRLTATFSTTF